MSYEYDKLKGQLDELATTIQEKTDTKELLTITEMNQIVKDTTTAKEFINNRFIDNKTLTSIKSFPSYILKNVKGEGTIVEIKDCILESDSFEGFEYNKFQGIIKFTNCTFRTFGKTVTDYLNAYKIITDYPIYLQHTTISYLEFTKDVNFAQSLYPAPNLLEYKINGALNQPTISGCDTLITCDFGETFEKLEKINANSLTFLVIRNTTKIVNISSIISARILAQKGDGNPNGEQLGHIYVPDELLEDYKADSNWSKYINALKPLSEYENDVINTKILYFITDKSYGNIFQWSFDNKKTFININYGYGFRSSYIMFAKQKIFIKITSSSGSYNNILIQYKNIVKNLKYNEDFEIDLEDNTENEYIWIGDEEWVKKYANKLY